jgi:AGZA family xanthine/uracil permease-like MFS transporter
MIESTTRVESPGRSTFSGDVIGGVTTFVTLAYIVIVNPGILSTPGTGMPFSGALTATVLVASSMTLLMGLYARLPFAVAPGMGLNAFFAFTIVIQNKVPCQRIGSMVFWAGVLFLVVSITPLREQIALAIPPALRKAAGAGIGLLLTFIGLRNAGIVVSDPATIVRMGALDHRAVFLVIGILIAATLMRRGNPLAFLAAIFVVTALAWATGYAQRPDRIVGMPDFSSTFLALDVRGALRFPLLPAIVAILFTDLFDSLSTFGRQQCGRLTDPEAVNQPASRADGRRGGDARQVLQASPGTACVRHRRNPHGRRTAAPLSSWRSASCHAFSRAPGRGRARIRDRCGALLVGASMFQSISSLDFYSIEDVLPAFVTVILIPLTLSITQGILWGFLLHAALYTVTGRWKEVGAVLWLLAALSAGLLLLARCPPSEAARR